MQRKNVFYCHPSLFFLFDSMYFLVLNAANVLNKKCANDSLNNLFLSSVFEAWKSCSLFMGLYIAAFAIFVFRIASFCQWYEILIE